MCFLMFLLKCNDAIHDSCRWPHAIRIPGLTDFFIGLSISSVKEKWRFKVTRKQVKKQDSYIPLESHRIYANGF